MWFYFSTKFGRVPSIYPWQNCPRKTNQENFSNHQ